MALYLCAANGSTQLAGTLGLWQSGIEVHALVVTSGMFRLQGGVHANALSYYMEGYLQRPPTTSRSTPISIWTSSSWTAMCRRST